MEGPLSGSQSLTALGILVAFRTYTRSEKSLFQSRGTARFLSASQRSKLAEMNRKRKEEK